MPPKLNKAQLRKLEKERLEQERIEREAKEEEERIKEVERLRIKEEKQKAKDAAFADAEKIRIAAEEVEMSSTLLKLRTASNIAEKDYLAYEEWMRFTDTDSKEAVDPKNETGITGLLSQFQEIEIEQKLEIEPILLKVQETEDLNNKILAIKERASIEDDKQKIAWCDNYVDEFRKITLKKVDKITSHLANNTDILIANKMEELKQLNENAKYKIAATDQTQQKPEILLVHSFMDYGYGVWVFAFEKTGPRPKPIDFKELNIQSDVPRTLVASKIIMRVLWTAYDYQSPKEYCKEHIVGGIVDVCCYNYLQQPDDYKDYKLKKIYEGEDGICKHNYPMPDTTGVINYQSVTPVKIFFTLPGYQYVGVSDKIKVVLWDFATKTWSTEHVEDIKFDFDRKVQTVSALTLAPLAFSQERAIDFPYKSWKIRRTSITPTFQPNKKLDLKYDTIVIDIEGKRMSLRFEVTAGKVFLRQKTEPELAHLVDRAFEPAELLYQLKRSGINLLPVDEDAEVCSIPLKDSGAQHKAIEDISVASLNFYIASTKWNLNLPSDSVGARLRHNPECDEEFHEDQEKDWMTISWWENKCAILRIRESQDTPDMKRIKNTLTHSNLYLLMKNNELATPEALDDFYNMHNALLYSTMQKFLKHTKLLSFSLA